MKQTITRIAVILTWIMGSWMPAAWADGLPYVQDFTTEAKAAQAKQVPILVLFMSPHCVYCERVLQEFLLPMGRNADYDTKVIMRQIDMGSESKLLDFKGRSTTQSKFASMHKVRMVPTIKVFDAQGNELADPIVGLLTPDYYGGYLDNAIDQGLAKIRAN
ncbi:thioredoxin fold domain-containing protein [Sulfurirhabdus autotrophica]|uniref:Thioredoxin-like protein n=1 Tax=Sulfurirhabdus autotrophica TaxID=1706046 RepID=A0A4R3Y6A6_9PROT|nr:thioredoxin fold domain-containing protein [Sulfurirhabdus autotrophica]TCV86388.1 thioredoxin-like protein [Sulfurirhabdus autotrophica]